MNNIIAQNLKKLRETARYTQEELSMALGIKRSAYSNYESGGREIPYDLLEKLSDFYGCDASMLFETNQNVNAMILASAFRLEGLSPEDASEIIRFKGIVKSYIKMKALESK